MGGRDTRVNAFLAALGIDRLRRLGLSFDSNRQRTRHRLAAVGVSLLVGLVVTWLAVDLFPYHTVNDDEGVYLMQAAMLLEGKLFLHPSALTEAVRPWFFVVQEHASAPGGVRLYSKYSPAVPALFALGLAVGLPNLVLGVVASVTAWFVYVLTAAVFDRRTGIVAAGLLGLSPLFLITSSTFLAYAPTTMLNLIFGVCYVRAARRNSVGYAVVAGAFIGFAFFARPYTAVLFALPFMVHSLWALATSWRVGTGRAVARRYVAIALPGIAFVGLTLAYNAVVTGDPLTFPYIAFAPADGIGFGRREILGYDIVYTPALGIETAVEALDMLVTRWGPMGWFGTVAAIVGVGVAVYRRWQRATGRRARGGDRRRQHGLGDRETAGFVELSDTALAAVVAGVFGSVFLGNVFFWGTHNGLRNGLIDLLGPFYHFDALVPLVVFAAAGLVGGVRAVRGVATRRFSPSEARGVVFSVVLVSALVAGGVTLDAIDDPYSENHLRTENLEATYDPLVEAGFEEPPLTPSVPGVSGANASKVLVFHPDPYGDWSAHPFQTLRNDPGFDGSVVYAIDDGPEQDFTVLDATNRTPYRFAYRGSWVGAEEPVEPALTRLEVLAGERVEATTTLGAPKGSTTVSVRVETESGYARYDSRMRENLSVDWAITPSGVFVTNHPKAAGPDRLPIPNGTSEIDLLVTYVGDFGETVTYRQTVSVDRSDGEVRVIWPPETRVCRLTTDCGTEGQWVGPDGDYLPGVSVASNATVATSNATMAASVNSEARRESGSTGTSQNRSVA
ncbi:membrane protein [Haloferax mucosum ATCC BAA-1512]|uniref:Membrane protein n=1 Tax=Haloferax mucosum ATCC BAA-1512 TaxID=662479 RepID=M0ISB7_9EURY|nr:glycosyltransferase family 39 protein [Haloferax mucosum]ELZ98708.1 membrane protein [Haloferax mucosum ATCC BAA-1512]